MTIVRRRPRFTCASACMHMHTRVHVCLHICVCVNYWSVTCFLDKKNCGEIFDVLRGETQTGGVLAVKKRCKLQKTSLLTHTPQGNHPRSTHDSPHAPVPHPPLARPTVQSRLSSHMHVLR